MRRFICLLTLTATLLGGQAVRAEWFFDGGIKLWYAEPKLADRAMMFGPSAVVSIHEQYWLRAFYLYGNYDYVREPETRAVDSFGLHDAELVGGLNWHIFHVGAGLRWSTVLLEEDTANGRLIRNRTAGGPVLAAGIAQSLAEWPWGFTGSPWGWYVGGSVMFYDFEDDDGEHLNLEAGVTHMSHGLYKSIGYRYQNTFDHGHTEGFTATFMLEF